MTAEEALLYMFVGAFIGAPIAVVLGLGWYLLLDWWDKSK